MFENVEWKQRLREGTRKLADNAFHIEVEGIDSRSLPPWQNPSHQHTLNSPKYDNSGLAYVEHIGQCLSYS